MVDSTHDSEAPAVAVEERSGGGNGFFIALRVELFAKSRAVGPWLVTILPALAVAIRLALVKLTGGAAGEDAASGGYGQLVDGFSTGLTLLYLILTAYAAYDFAVDRDQGVVRHLIIRRVSRRALLAAKFVLLNALALLGVAAVLLTSYLLTRLFWDLGPVVEDGFEIIGVDAIREEVRTGLILALLPLPAALALGLLISVVARSAVQAVAVAAGAMLIADIFKSVLGKGAHYVFATFQPSLMDQSYLGDVARIVRGYSDVLIDERVYQLNLWVPAPEALIFLLLALWAVSRRPL